MEEMSSFERYYLEKHGYDLDRMIPVSEIYEALGEAYDVYFIPKKYWKQNQEKALISETAREFREIALMKLGIVGNKNKKTQKAEN